MSVSFVDKLSNEKKSFDGGKNAIREKINSFFSDLLEVMNNTGDIPWRRPWNKEANSLSVFPLPRNALTGKTYSGFNFLHLDFVMSKKGYHDPRFLTVKQANSLGGGIAKGEKGVGIFFLDHVPVWRTRRCAFSCNGENVRVVHVDADRQTALVVPINGTRKNVKPVSLDAIDAAKVQNGKPIKVQWAEVLSEKRIPIMKATTVFNVSQCVGLEKFLEKNPLPTAKPLAEKDVNDLISRIVQGMEKTGMRFQLGYDRACYVVPEDRVCLPNPDSFVEKNLFEAILLHEIGHGTGHPSRLNRFANTSDFLEYDKEELVAEMFSYMVGRFTGINAPIPHHAAYIQHWNKMLQESDGQKTLFWALRKADEAIHYIENVADIKFSNILQHNHVSSPHIDGIIVEHNTNNERDHHSQTINNDAFDIAEGNEEDLYDDAYSHRF